MRKKENGFTLIELMVTIAVLAIVASIAAPSFLDTLASQRLTTASNEIVSVFSESRRQAMVLNNTVAVCLSKDSAKTSVTETACITQLLPTANVNQVIAQKRVQLVNISEKVNVESADYGVVFNANGTVSSPITIEVCSNGKSKTVSVALIGTLSQSKGTC